MAAFTEEKFFTRGTKFGKDWRISILQDGGPGAGDRITAKDKFFTKNYTFTNDRSFWNQKIIEPVLEVTIRFNPSEESFYRSIVESPDDTYRLQFQYDGSVDVFGSIRGDMVTITEQAAPKTITLRAKPLTVQRGLKYPLKGSASYVEIAPLIGDLVNQTDTDLNIYTYSDWTDPTGGGSDYFNAAALDTYHLRDYAGSKSQDQQLTYFEALERVIPEGHILTLSNGAWHLMSLPYIAKQAGNNVDRYEYTWGGTVYALNATSSVDMRKSLNSENLLLTTQSQSKHYSAYKRITQEFNHKTLISSLSFDASYLHEDIGDSPATETQEDFESDGNQRISMSGEVRVKTDDTGGNFKTGSAQILLRAGTYEYNLSTDTWESAGSEFDITLAGTGQFLARTFSFSTAPIPSDADGTLTVELRWASDDGNNFSWTTQEVEWKNVALDIINGDVAADNAAIDYELEQTQQFAETLDLPDRIFGQGPTPYSRSAIRYLSGGNYQQLTAFSHKGDASSVDYAELLMADIMDAQRNGTRVIKAKLWMEYEIGDVITYDGDQYLFLGGDFNGKVSQWQGYLYKLDHNTGSDTLTTIYETANQPTTASSGSSSSGGGLTESDANSLYLNELSNLSDLDNFATARTNLGVEIGTDVQAWDAELDTLSGMTSSQATGLVGTSGTATFNNVEVTGTINYVNEDNLQVEDATITINKNGTDGSAEGAGIIIERPSGNETLLWDSTSGFDFSDSINVTGTGTFSGLLTAQAGIDVTGQSTIESFEFTTFGAMNWGSGFSNGRLTWGTGYAQIESLGTNELRLVGGDGNIKAEDLLTAQAGIRVEDSGELATSYARTTAGTAPFTIDDVRYLAPNSSGSERDYGSVLVESLDNTAGAGEGRYTIRVRGNGNPREAQLIAEPTGVTILNLLTAQAGIRVDGTYTLGNIGGQNRLQFDSDKFRFLSDVDQTLLEIDAGTRETILYGLLTAQAGIDVGTVNIDEISNFLTFDTGFLGAGNDGGFEFRTDAGGTGPVGYFRFYESGDLIFEVSGSGDGANSTLDFRDQSGSKLSVDESGLLTVQTGIAVNTSTLTSGFVADFNGDVLVRDDLEIGGGLIAEEFIVDQFRSVPTYIMSPAHGRIDSITDSTLGAEKIVLEDPRGNTANPFQQGDIVIIKVLDVDDATLKEIYREVAQINPDGDNGLEILFQTTNITWDASTDDFGSIEEGDFIVQQGHISDTTRDHYIRFDVAGLPIPAIRIFDSVTDVNDSGNEIVRMGGLDPSGANEFNAGTTGDQGFAVQTGAGDLAFYASEDKAGLVDLDVEGTLTMSTNGEITNSSGDYSITEDGLEFERLTTATNAPREIRWSQGGVDPSRIYDEQGVMKVQGLDSIQFSLDGHANIMNINDIGGTPKVQFNEEVQLGTDVFAGGALIQSNTSESISDDTAVQIKTLPVGSHAILMVKSDITRAAIFIIDSDGATTPGILADNTGDWNGFTGTPDGSTPLSEFGIYIDSSETVWIENRWGATRTFSWFFFT